MPVKSNAGKDMKLPPPARELATPAASAAENSRAASEELTLQFNGREHRLLAFGSWPLACLIVVLSIARKIVYSARVGDLVCPIIADSEDG